MKVRAGLELLHAVHTVGHDDLARADLDGLRVEYTVVLGDPHPGDRQVRGRLLHAHQLVQFEHVRQRIEGRAHRVHAARDHRPARDGAREFLEALLQNHMLAVDLDVARHEWHVLGQLGSRHVELARLDHAHKLDVLVWLVHRLLVQFVRHLAAALGEVLHRLLGGHAVLAVDRVGAPVLARGADEALGQRPLLERVPAAHLAVQVGEQDEPASGHDIQAALVPGRVEVRGVDVLPDRVGRIIQPLAFLVGLVAHVQAEPAAIGRRDAAHQARCQRAGRVRAGRVQTRRVLAAGRVG